LKPVQQIKRQLSKGNKTMKRNTLLPASGLAACLLFTLAAMTVHAQQITGIPGSHSTTTTIDGKQLPPPPQKFGGVIRESAKDSKPYWPARVVPPKRAPNILLIMTDDQGYGVSGTFSGDSFGGGGFRGGGGFHR